jgi:DNA-binding response OmpR family regulator
MREQATILTAEREIIRRRQRVESGWRRLRMTECANCIRLTRELREALELVAEYERAPKNVDARAYQINNWLHRPCQIQSAKMLKALLDADGKVVLRDRLAFLMNYQGDLPAERILTVNGSRLNKALENKGLPRAVRNAFGQGYYIETKNADAIRAAMENA